MTLREIREKIANRDLVEWNGEDAREVILDDIDAAIAAAIAEERAKPEDDARDLALDLASDIWEPNTLYVGARNQWLVSASLKIEVFAAERERKLAERCANAAERWFYNTIASLESVELEGFLKPLREKQIATLRAAIREATK